MTETDTEDIAIETLEKDRTENQESTTPMLQNFEIKIIKEKILRELGKIQNTKISNREPLHKIQNNRENQLKICTGNNALREILKMSEPSLMQLSNVIYATAKVLTEECTSNKKRKGNRRKKPLWKEKIEKEIEYMRGELSILSELQRGVNVKGRRFRKMTKKYQLTSKNILEVNEMIKQKMQLKAQRMWRYDKRSKFYRQNMIFKTDAKKFYREVGKEKILIRQAPPIENVEKYWKTVWSSDKKFNGYAEWVETIEENSAHIEEKQWPDITTGEVEKL